MVLTARAFGAFDLSLFMESPAAPPGARWASSEQVASGLSDCVLEAQAPDGAFQQAGASYITFSDITSEVPQCHFCHFFFNLVKSESQTQPHSKRGDIDHASQWKKCQGHIIE